MTTHPSIEEITEALVLTEEVDAGDFHYANAHDRIEVRRYSDDGEIEPEEVEA